MALQVDAWGGRVVTMEMDPVNVTWSHSGSVKGVVWQGQVGARRQTSQKMLDESPSGTM